MNTFIQRRVILAGVLLAATGSVWAADAAPDAAKTYAAKCASCHAKDGKGNPAMAKVFKLEPDKLSLVGKATQDKSDADLIKVTAEGAGKMPAYKAKLSDAEIAGLVSYIRSLAPKK